MQNTSTLYNQILADKNHRFEVKLSINGVDYGTDSIFSAKTKSRIFDNKPTIGGCYSATLDFTIISDGANIPRMASVVPYFRVVNNTQVSEWVQHGLYFIDQRTVTNNGDDLSVFKAECFDAMLKANASYSTSGLSWPALDTQIVAEIASAMGVPVDPRTTAILTKGFSINDLPVSYTYRDVLSFIAVAYAGNWIITDEGKLRLIPIVGNNDTLPIDKELMSMNVSQKRNGYTKVVISISEEEAIISGASDDLIMEAYCPYITQAIADDILTTLSSYKYEPFEANGVWSNPAIEIGDKLTAVEKTVTIYARTVNYGPGMVMNLSAPDDGYIDHEYAYESPTQRHYKQTLGDIRREIVVTADTISSTISRRLDNMQEQIDNNIETFTGSAVPTLSNYPANAWTTTDEKDKHIGDLYVVNSQGGDYEGFYYRFEKTGSTYQWRLLKDTEVTKALAEAEEALRRVGIAETQIEQNAEAITLRATKTEAQGYANTAQANAISTAASDATTKANAAESAAKSYADAQITISADAITSNVSATYETKSDSATKLNTAKTYAEGQASAAERGAKSYTDGKLTDYSTTAQMNSAITQSAASITSTVSATYETKNDAASKLNTANTYAENQASAAEAGAKGYTDNKLTGYSTTTQMNSAIEQSASSITQSVAATYTTKEEFANLDVGGRNYLPGSKEMSLWALGPLATLDTSEEFSVAELAGTTANWSANINTRPTNDIAILDGSDFTFSFEYQSTVDIVTNVALAGSNAEPGSPTASRTKYATLLSNKIIPSTNGKWERFSLTAESLTVDKMTSGSGNVNSFYFQIFSRTDNSVLKVRKFKFEKGNKATDWTPATEDAEERITKAEAELTIQANEIASKVSETDFNGNTIASKINQSATTVKINAAKIDLQGAVTISDFNSAAQATLVKNTTTKNQYAQSASSTTAPTSGWQDAIPAYNATNKYIWIRVETTKTFADNSTDTSHSTPVVDINLTKSIQDAATAQSTADTALGTTKSTQQYYLSTSSTSATDGTWQNTVPTWSSGTYVWTRIKTDATTKSGTPLTPVYSTAVYDANLTTALSTASSASSAASAAQTTANGAVKSTSVKTEYYLSSSSSSATGGEWKDVIPTWVDGRYLWTRIATTTTPVSGTASTTYQPSENGTYDKNLTTALSTATAAAAGAAAAQTKANAALVQSVPIYYRSTTNSTPSKPSVAVTSTAVDTDNTWTLAMPRPKKGTYYYTAEQNTDGLGNVTWTTVRQMANTTYVAGWAMANNATYIDGANIYAGSVTAAQIDVNDLFAQNITATNFKITGGSIDIETGSGNSDKIILRYDNALTGVRPFGFHIMHKNYSSYLDKALFGADYSWGSMSEGGSTINYATSRLQLRNINTANGNVLYESEQGADYFQFNSAGVRRAYWGIGGLKFYNSSNKQTADYGPDVLTLGSTNKALLTADSLVFRDASDNVTAKYLNRPTSTNYTPSNTTLTFHSDSVIRVRNLGSVGVYSVLMQLNNPGDFATGTYYDILTLPEGHRPWYVVSHIACNGVGSPVYIRVNTNGVVSIYRYAGAAWTNSWIRVEIPVIFANP